MAKSKWSQSNDEIVRYKEKCRRKANSGAAPTDCKSKKRGCCVALATSRSPQLNRPRDEALITCWRQPRSTAARRQSTMFWVALCPCSQHSALQHANGMAFVSMGGNLPQLQPAVFHWYHSHLGEKDEQGWMIALGYLLTKIKTDENRRVFLQKARETYLNKRRTF